MDRDFEEVHVTLNEGSELVEKVFQGKLIARVARLDDGFETVYRLYTTAQEKLACVVCKNPAWQTSSSYDDEMWGKLTNNAEWWHTRYELYVATSMEELEGPLGKDIVEALQANTKPKRIEYLDI